MQSLIDVFRMVEINPKTRAAIIIKLGRAIDDEHSMVVTRDLVRELVKILDPENEIFKGEQNV